MRSQISQQWLNDEAGILYPRVRGGYKAMRRFLLDELDVSANEIKPLVIGGKTGVGKTLFLQRFQQAIDLEAMAWHRGSAFGRHATPQPTQIDFENTLSIALIKHRKEAGAKPASFSHSTSAEIIWTVIPVVILLLMAVPAAETLIKLEDSRDPDMTVVATGYQWKWHYRYQDQDVEFYSTLARPSIEARPRQSGIDPETVENYLLDVDNPLVVPKGKKIRLLLTSNDVLHAWWVPDLAIKKDAIPGMVNETWFRPMETGTFRGQCAELCGKDHGYMPIVVEVVEPDAFQAWVETRKENATAVASTN